MFFVVNILDSCIISSWPRECYREMDFDAEDTRTYGIGIDNRVGNNPHGYRTLEGWSYQSRAEVDGVPFMGKLAVCPHLTISSLFT